MSLEMAAPIWHAFMQDTTKGMPVVDFHQPAGVTWASVDAYSGMLPGPYTTRTYKEVFVDGTVPTQVDTTKVSFDVDSTTNTLWTYDCPGVKVTKGYLNLSQVDSTNPTWQQYDNIWASRATKGTGVKGGPNNSATSYFYKVGFWTPFGKTWGAPFPPTKYCTSNTGSPPPSPIATPTPVPTDTPVPTEAPTAEPTAPPVPTDTPAPTPSPAPSGLVVMPLSISLFGFARRRRGQRGSRPVAPLPTKRGRR
jgi:hypothetical protein